MLLFHVGFCLLIVYEGILCRVLVSLRTSQSLHIMDPRFLKVFTLFVNLVGWLIFFDGIHQYLVFFPP